MAGDRPPTEGMVVKAEVGSLVASGLPQSSVSSWTAIQPHVTDDFDRDLDRYISYWEQTYRLLSALPAKPSRSDLERAAAQTLLTAGRESRERFLNAHTVNCMTDSLHNAPISSGSTDSWRPQPMLFLVLCRLRRSSPRNRS